MSVANLIENATSLVSGASVPGPRRYEGDSNRRNFQAVCESEVGASSTTVSLWGSCNGKHWVKLLSLDLASGEKGYASDSKVVDYCFEYFRVTVDAISGSGARVSAYLAV